ncbi:MAG: NAD(P)/FAD-dependent oxidoreductase [Deltaproteobacteria bacterium]|nr:NAD(P)/FAD-dependent oxidoreductase [Candidatus Anaeroferrophillus wilburensis]MBN2890209.1 NAD(P)/FAD-dependent oxidoreductase [Deltaproteobacteria bacterium]
MENVEVTIIGAGVVGLAVAAQLAPSLGHHLLVVEKHDRFGVETSSRNSEVIHAGIYYPSTSAKARLCVRGRRLLYDLCRRHAIAHRQLGKLIVAANRMEEEQLALIVQRGFENGVDDLSIITGEHASRLEPAVQAQAAILSPSTGIIDSHQLMRCYYQQAKSQEVLFAFGTTIETIQPAASGFTLKTAPDGYAFRSKTVINCAGLGAGDLSRQAGLPTPPLYYAKGTYFSYSGTSPVNRLIYPAPSPTGHGLGIHATLDLGGRLRFGPDLQYLPEPDYLVDETRKVLFHQAVSRYLPALEINRLAPDMAGVRPRLQGPTDDFRDFIIRDESTSGLPGFINLLGIESPGLTAAPAIAEEVANLLAYGG